MKRLVLALLTVLMLSSAASAADYVRGYMRRDGSYVPGHYRSSADGYRYNNYSTQGNYNPYTGRSGYQPLYPSYRSNFGSPYRSYNYGY
jgi:hypothetical protein